MTRGDGKKALFTTEGSAWAPLLNADDINHGLPLLSLCMASRSRAVHYWTNQEGTRPGHSCARRKEAPPVVVEAMRQYWMQI